MKNLTIIPYALLYRFTKRATVYGVMFHDFPGCITVGDTLKKALSNAKIALTFHVSGMLRNGEQLPVISSYDEVRVNPEYDGMAVIAIKITVTDKDLL